MPHHALDERRDLAATLRIAAPDAATLCGDWTAAGPPPFSPFALPPVREAANLLEYAVHHEDVRRAAPGWEPRPVPVARQRAIFTRLRVAAPVTMRGMADRVQLAWPSHGSFPVHRGPALVTVTGPPVELALVAFGRQRVAQVSYDGPEDAVARVSGATIAI